MNGFFKIGTPTLRPEWPGRSICAPVSRGAWGTARRAAARDQPEGAYGALITTRTPDLRHRERALDKPEVFCCADTSESPHTIIERVNIE